MIGLINFCQLLSLIAVQANAHSAFQNYNNEGRQNSEEALNEVDSVDLHWAEEKVEIDNENVKYEPTWASLDARPLPNWYDQSKIGIFIHWGVFSVPAITNEWFWYDWKNGNNETKLFMEQNYKPGTTYQELAHEFTAEFYNPGEWAQLFKKSGAKYIVLTSKHHEGYTLWPSRYSFSWNAKDVGPNRDLVGDLATAIRNLTDLRFGLYHSLFEFYNPLYLNDKKNKLKTDEFVRFKTMPELYELVEAYQPEVVWSDGDWLAPDSYWKSQEFIAWLYNESPVKDTVVTNDRWGSSTRCKHGGYYTCSLSDKYNPGSLQPHKWENCFTLDKHSWGYRRNAKIGDYLTPEELMTTIVESVSCGGNVLINVGPTKEGTIPLIQQERLLQMGDWLEVNGEAIYSTIPYKVQKDTLTPGVWYTMSQDGKKTYAMITKWPGENIILGSVNPAIKLQVQMLGADGDLTWTPSKNGVRVNIPRPDKTKSQWVWTLVFTISEDGY